ncbi:MAG: hypothetical protein AAF690_06280 [Acidobacteriota bacterium]
MDLLRFMEILNVSTGRSLVSEVFPMPPQRVPWPSMPIKDLSRCLDAGRDLGVSTPLVQASLDAGIPETANDA